MEKYSKAVSEMNSQFRKGEPYPLEKYIGRLAMCFGEEVEVVGYCADNDSIALLIVDASKIKSRAWDRISADDVVFKRCEAYNYVTIIDLID